MTKGEFWLKLFSENKTALAVAIHLIERFVTEDQLKNGSEFLMQKRIELDNPMPEEIVREVFSSKTGGK